MNDIDYILKYDSYPAFLSLRINNFHSSKEVIRFSKACEKIIRASLEYRLWKDFVINVLGNDYCFVTHEKQNEVTIEVHHHIPSLFTIVKSIINKNLDNKISFCTFDVALQTIELHYQDKIGYVLLVKTIHEKFHNGFLKIPSSLVRGNYRQFLEEWGRYIDDDHMKTIEERLAVNDSEGYPWMKDHYPGLMREFENAYNPDN